MERAISHENSRSATRRSPTGRTTLRPIRTIRSAPSDPPPGAGEGRSQGGGENPRRAGIGNSEYKSAPLANPVNDAGFCHVLRKLGFE